MKTISPIPIPLSKLVVNIENPRFEIVGDQLTAIEVMLKNQNKKIINLANDISEYGLNPSDLTIVSPHETEKDHYNVLEGNRRIVALKLLNNPNIIKKNKLHYEKFKEIKKNIPGTLPKKIHCIVFKNKADANHWITLKHTGENDGVGTVRWDAQQTARFDEGVSNKSSIALQAIDFLKHSKAIDEYIKNNISRLPITNLHRLLADKKIQQLLGIRIIDGLIMTNVKEEEIAKGLTKIANDLIKKNIKVKHIYLGKDRVKYIEEFLKHEIPQKRNKVKTIWELASLKAPISKPSTATKKRMRSISIERETLIPTDFVIRIHESKINKIYSELKNINCNEYNNAAAVLFRVFVELSIDAYISRHRFPIGIDKELYKKANKIADHFEKENILTKHELKGIRTAVNNPHNLLSFNNFNAYVHNRHFSPVPGDLKIAWDNIQLFIEKIWEKH